MIIGTKNLIFSENGISFVNAVIYYILRFLLSCLTFTVNFFTCLFLIKKSTSKPFYEETEQYSKVSKFDFTFKNPFKRRSTNKTSSFNIEPSLKKTESIIKEDSEY